MDPLLCDEIKFKGKVEDKTLLAIAPIFSHKTFVSLDDNFVKKKPRDIEYNKTMWLAGLS